jgi:type VI protein secretion system component VasF
MKLTQAQYDALKWLKDRGGDGVFIQFRRVLAQGEVAPHMWSTWKALIKLGFCGEYRQGSGKRIYIVEQGPKYRE